jgi:hypothetical protein
MNVLEPVYGWTDIRTLPPSLTTLARPLPTA